MAGTIRHQRTIREIREGRNIREEEHGESIIIAVVFARLEWLKFYEGR